MSQRERTDKAANHNKEAYPQDMICEGCGYRWMQHLGLLCPVKPGGFIPLRDGGEPIPVMPIFHTDQFFIPSGTGPAN